VFPFVLLINLTFWVEDTVLDEQTWKSIEIVYLTTQLKAEEGENMNYLRQLWYPIRAQLLKTPPEDGRKISWDDLDIFFQKITSLLSSSEVSQQNPATLKYLYNMFCIAIRYHQGAIIHQIEKGTFKSSIENLINLLCKAENRLSEMYLEELRKLRDTKDNPYNHLISGLAKYGELEILEQKVNSINAKLLKPSRINPMKN
jgi:hypothetical protein